MTLIEDNILPSDELQRLQAVGFTVAGRWASAGTGLSVEFSQHATAHKVLYAFVTNGQLMYLGNTVKPLTARMSQHKTPSLSQSTNVTNHHNIRNLLQQGKSVTIYVLHTASTVATRLKNSINWRSSVTSTKGMREASVMPRSQQGKPIGLEATFACEGSGQVPNEQLASEWRPLLMPSSTSSSRSRSAATSSAATAAPPTTEMAVAGHATPHGASYNAVMQGRRHFPVPGRHI